MQYESFYEKSIRNPEAFWKEQADQLAWYQKPETILSKNEDGYDQWFADGSLNLSYLCIDKHIEDGYGEQPALIYDSPVTDTKKQFTFNELKDQVSRLAGGLQSLGLEKGDTVIIYMPMIPEAVFAMLACVRIGVIHSVVFGGFAPHELAIRIDDCKPKVIITASNGIEITRIIPYKPFVDQAIEEAEHRPESVVIFDRKLGVEIPARPYDVDYAKLVREADPVDPIPVASTHPSYILYTSGTTGKPKGIIRDTGGYATALKFSMKYVYGVQPGDTYWAASDVGWVVGHSYIVYGPLINRNTTVLFEGKPIKTPDASTFWRVISEYGVKVMFTAPTAIRAIKKEDPEGKLLEQFDLSGLKYQFLAGERCDVATLQWTEEQLKVPVVDHWWQTESGWPMLSNMVGVEVKPIKPGSATLPVCGYDIRILDEHGVEVGAEEEGYVAVKLPLPPGTLMSLWGNPERFREGYLSRFDGYYFSGDGGYRDEDGYIFITGRVDDIINVAGHRLSTAELEEVVAAHPAVAECAVFGVHCDLRGQKPLGLVVLKSGVSIEAEQLEKEIVQDVRSQIGAVAAFREVRIVKRLPKTRSGKILRKLLRSLANKENYTIPSTIDDVQIIDEIKEVM
ncbi:propionyl-CoA synthetase [Flavilitoribacter nigricans]|uniref:Propionyl-CoA synthetase n=1 Tax=Flavilitoribacter nigricans (strain ATCC 23147 / DSM 23189 / NBRC 102662 / NCIMB 1420 / SS-2) TaxID=1122177 RepID=A0A2D0MYU9_FLAN2|nr:propionyl-CoA synthetase [Flavilitoribacter nigricans]PHN01451.1 propionyl-CoA synthetase [Flavilitoribacter nigricans DSM 23189 = NBRC 102662]